MVPSSVPSVSAKHFAEAAAVIPGGVNSPVRAFSSVGGTPRYITSARGYWLTDADGNRYVDLICSWGPMILGHAHPAVVDAVQRAAVRRRAGPHIGRSRRGMGPGPAAHHDASASRCAASSGAQSGHPASKRTPILSLLLALRPPAILV